MPPFARFNLQNLRNSKLFHDASWAVVGNGFANALLLIAGIIIARLLGRDLYGQYGYVKTMMLTIAGMVTFGLGITSTRYVAQIIEDNAGQLRSLIRDAQRITITLSCIFGLILIAAAPCLAEYLGKQGFCTALRMLGLLVMVRSVITMQNGVLAGLKEFDTVARNSIVSGIIMITACVPLTYFYSLNGALSSLLFSQFANCFFNHLSIRCKVKEYPKDDTKRSYVRELLTFSFPVALQEFSYTLCGMLGISILTKLSSIGEVGLYTASAQWNAVVLMIPSLLGNIVLSYLSGTVSNRNKHHRIFNMLLLANFLCTLVPFFVVMATSGIIVSMYGESFAAMKGVLTILVFSSVFECCANVFRSEFIALGRTKTVTYIRIARDIFCITAVYVVLTETHGISGAMNYALVMVASSMLFLMALAIAYYLFPRHNGLG